MMSLSIIEDATIDLCFDILEDLTDELIIEDYFIFSLMNELTYELTHNIVRKVHYYCCCNDYLEGQDDEGSNDIDLAGIGSHICDDYAIGVAKWIYQFRSRDDFVDMFRSAIPIACDNGESCILEWLCGLKEKYMLGMDHAVICACLSGNLNILEFLVQKGFDKSRIKGAFGSARNREVLEFLHSENFECCEEDIIDICESKKSIDMIEFLGSDERYSSLFSKKMIDRASKKGRLDIVLWLYNNRDDGWSCEAVDWASQNGHLEVVKFLVEKNLLERKQMAEANIPYFSWELKYGGPIDAFENACYRGHMNIVEYLFEMLIPARKILNRLLESDKVKPEIKEWLNAHRDGFMSDR